MWNNWAFVYIFRWEVDVAVEKSGVGEGVLSNSTQVYMGTVVEGNISENGRILSYDYGDPGALTRDARWAKVGQ